MIVHDGKKAKQLSKGDTEYYMIYKGDNLIYNRYSIVNNNKVTIYAGGNSARFSLKSNSSWKINK